MLIVIPTNTHPFSLMHHSSCSPRMCGIRTHGGLMQPALGPKQDICRYISISMLYTFLDYNEKPHTCHNKHTLARAFSSQPFAFLRQGESEKISFIKTYVLKCKFVINEYRSLSVAARGHPIPEYTACRLVSIERNRERSGRS